MNFEKFERLPETALQDITPPGDSVLTDAEILETGKHADENILNNPAVGNNSGQPIKLGAAVSGKFAVEMADTIIPPLVVWLISFAKFKTEKKQFSLSAKEKETLHPLVQAYLDSVNISFNNPLHNLLFGTAMIYGAKVVELIPSLQKISVNEKPTRKNAVKIAANIQTGSVNELIQSIANRRKKGVREAIIYFNANKEKFGRENEPDILIPE